VEHMEWMSEGLPHSFTVEGNELLITPGKEGGSQHG
jgi:hypothetical protein